MRFPSLTKATLVCLLVAAGALSTSASAATPIFVGTWSEDPSQCKTPQTRPGAPLVLTADSYKQGETQCQFKSVLDKGENSFSIAGLCNIQGTRENRALTLTVSGNTLTVGDDAGATDYYKCP